MTFDLTSLPAPQILDDLTLKDLRDRVLTNFIEAEPDYESLLASDPAVTVLDTYVFREFVLRLRINSAIKGMLLAYATGANLDNIAANFLIERLTDETDEDFRARIQERGLIPSAAGPANIYKYHALSSSTDVVDARVYSPAPGEVEIAILGPVDVNDGVPSEELLETVYDYVNSDTKRVLTDLLTVVPAVKITQNVTAVVSLLPDTPQSVFDNLQADFETAHEEYSGLGKDLTKSWIISQLHVDGVHSVTLSVPTSDVVAEDNEFVVLGTVTITQGDRGI